MPQNSQNNMKGTSPSPLVQRVVDQSWGQQNKDTTTAQQAISQQYNKHPVAPGDTKPTP